MCNIRVWVLLVKVRLNSLGVVSLREYNKILYISKSSSLERKYMYRSLGREVSWPPGLNPVQQGIVPLEFLQQTWGWMEEGREGGMDEGREGGGSASTCTRMC